MALVKFKDVKRVLIEEMQSLTQDLKLDSVDKNELKETKKVLSKIKKVKSYNKIVDIIGSSWLVEDYTEAEAWLFNLIIK